MEEMLDYCKAVRKGPALDSNEVDSTELSEAEQKDNEEAADLAGLKDTYLVVSLEYVTVGATVELKAV